MKKYSKSKKILFICGIFLVAISVLFNMLAGSIYQLPILMYHSINYTADKNDRMTVSPEAFTRQMKYLRDHKYNVITLEEAVSYIREKKHPPPKTVAVTIDDGYENNYTYAYPILKQYRVPVTIFVIVDMIGRPGFLNWDQISQMSASGIIGIESHTMTHPYFTDLDDAALRREFEDSKKILENKLNKNIDFICYPMGIFNGRVKLAAREAGYKAAFATKPTRLAPEYDLYEIKRVRISPTSNNLFVFTIKLSGYHAFFRVLQKDYQGAPSILWKKGS